MTIFKQKYIRLGEGLLPNEQQALERVIEETFAPVLPSELYVSELEQELVETAKRQYEIQQHMEQGLHVMGWIGGGLLSIVGGVLMWLLWRQHRIKKPSTKLSSDKSQFFEASSLSGA